uniref:phosphoribosylformylglycinamidine cyclo-ligase n=1 Tax=Panagrolaimus davidi TaxID=227884 RepID=A0A914QM68_9BILA
MPFSQDHKRAFEGDRGENTGGMGGIAPLFLSDSMEKEIKEILQKTVYALKDQGAEYKGVLYAGLMITKNGPKVLEYNCRFGDPETQVLLRLLNSDLYQICLACCNGNLNEIQIEWSNKCASGFVIASNGYPNSFTKGAKISGIPVDSDEVVTFFAGVKKSADGTLQNSGGRVLCVTAIGKSFYDAKTKALEVVEKINFSEKFYRRDIGRFVMSKKNSMSYESAGVNISEGNALVDSIKSACKDTLIPGTEQIGGFGALIDLKKAGFTDPLLVLGMDGVGTKLEIASEVGNFSSLGYDLVGMCVNDVLCHGAAPIAFLDYYVTGKLKKEEAAEVICGIAKACKEVGAALVGGETAEMPGVYSPKQWDLAGCCIAAKEREWPTLPEFDNIRIDDVIIGIASNGLHSNGFSLVRKIFKESGITFDKPTPWNANITFGDELLRPTKLYVKPLLQLVTSNQIKALSHITGGGLLENVPRILPQTLSAEIDCKKLHILEVFKWLQKAGDIEAKEMFRTFNCGIGMVAVLDPSKASFVLAEIEKAGIHAYEIGKICKKSESGKSIKLQNIEDVFDFGDTGIVVQKRANVAVFISGTGSNMINLINQASNPSSHCTIRLVICNKPEAKGLERARERGIEAICIPHGDDRHVFENKIYQELIKRDIDFICLAGFMRILTGEFTQKWVNRIINIHPSLLPSFKGKDAVKLALEAGVKVTGCTAHFVSEEVDAGKIIAQEVVAVEDNDDEKTLHTKIQEKEHSMFPKVMEIVAKSIVFSI